MGRGQRKDGPDAAVNQLESNAIRKELIPEAGGWIISPLGETIFGHADVTGTTLTSGTAYFYYLPTRSMLVRAAEARVSVAVADVSGTAKAALYRYVREPAPKLIKISGTEAVFNVASTGLKQVSLLALPEVQPTTPLFLGFLQTGTVVVEGFQSGAGVSPRVIRPLSKATEPSLASEYLLPALSFSSSLGVDTPLVAYLSAQASRVL